MKAMPERSLLPYLDSLYHPFVFGYLAICGTQGVVRPAAALPKKLAVAGLITAVGRCTGVSFLRWAVGTRDQAFGDPRRDWIRS